MSYAVKEDTIGWARKGFGRKWSYRCRRHGPAGTAGWWKEIKRYTVMDQGPSGKDMNEHPPTCGLCGTDLRYQELTRG